MGHRQAAQHHRTEHWTLGESLLITSVLWQQTSPVHLILLPVFHQHLFLRFSPAFVSFQNIDTDEKGHVIVDEFQNTSRAGIYAVGDVCGKALLTPGMKLPLDNLKPGYTQPF